MSSLFFPLPLCGACVIITLMSGQPDDTPDEERDQPQEGEQGGQPQEGQPPRGQQGGQPQERQPRRQQGGQPQGGQPPQGQQGGQPQGGQPPQGQQGGQPPQGQQGGQPQGGQPPQGQQGGQPQGGQPPQGQQGGQPPQGQQGGQPRRGQQPAGTGQSVVTEQLQEWVIYITGLFAISGIGFGILWILADAIEEPIYEADAAAGPGGSGSLFTTLMVMVMIMVIIAVAAVFLGAWLSRQLDQTGQEAFQTVGASVAAGAAVFFLLVALLLSIGFDNLSLAIGGLLINLILTAVFGAAIAVGGAWLTQNQAPSDL